MKYLVIILSIILFSYQVSFADISVSSKELFSVYDKNEINGDNKYKGKILVVRGVVESVGRDFANNIYISLEGDGFIRHVQCFFNEEHVDEVGDVESGSVIEVRGMCSGMVLNVMIEDCEIVK